jgi:hypothetical protein
MKLLLAMNFPIAFFVLASAVLNAGIVPIPGTVPVEPVFQKSDLVCNCEVVKTQSAREERIVEGGGVVVRKRVVATLQVIDAYKQKSDFGLAGVRLITYEDKLPFGKRGIMFLTAVTNSEYELTDTFIGAVPFSNVPLVTAALGLSKLQSALASVLGNNKIDDQVNALQLLQGFQELEPVSVAHVIPFTDSKDPQLVFGALAVLLKTGKPEFVSKLRMYLDNYHEESGPISLVSIGTELGQVDNVRALSDMEMLSESRLLSVRLGAMQSLRRLHAQQSAASLVRRLDDSNTFIQYLAVITLAETFNKSGDYAPAMDLFDKSSGKYIALWKSWWRKEKANPRHSTGG